MKMRMEFLSLDAQALDWLRDRLKGRELPEGAQGLLAALEELGAGRIDAMLLERTGGELRPALEEGVVRQGGLSIHPVSRKVFVEGREPSLTPKEFEILLLLARNPGEVFTKERIYRSVWDGSYLMDEGNIMAFIRKLRKKIEPDPDHPRYILTVWGVGYKFMEGGGPKEG